MRATRGHRQQNANEVPNFYYRPPQRNCWQGFHEFLWNPRDHTLCSRTPLNWFSITIYYIVFLCCVFGILYGSLEVVKWVAITMDPNKPRYSLDESPIGSTPSLNCVPINTKFGPLLRLDAEISSSIKEIDEFLGKYKNCEGPTCFNIRNLAECSVPPYGYFEHQPCIYLKLTRLIGWKPTPYAGNDTLPSNMPSDLKGIIENSTESKVWVSCKGTTPLDRDHITPDKVKYVAQGFEIYSYPFLKQKNYLDPIVAIKLNATDLTAILFSLTCSSWARNMDTRETSTAILIYA